MVIICPEGELFVVGLPAVNNIQAKKELDMILEGVGGCSFSLFVSISSFMDNQRRDDTQTWQSIPSPLSA